TNLVVAFLGPDVAQPFDLYVRDFAGDDGRQPSDAAFALQSPDLLVRHQPDVDATRGLEAYAFEAPLFDRTNYVYLAVRTRGAHLSAGATARLYWADPGSALRFPADWQTNGFYKSFTSDQVNTAAEAVEVPPVPARSGGRDGLVILGPILWRPPA